MSLAELRRWTLERNWSEKRRQELEAYLTRYLILHSDDQMCDRWAQAMNSARLRGRSHCASRRMGRGDRAASRRAACDA